MTAETTVVCRYTARLDEIIYYEPLVPVWPAVLNAATADPVEKLLTLYDGTEHRTATEVVHGLEMAIVKFTNFGLTWPAEWAWMTAYPPSPRGSGGRGRHGRRVR